MTSVSRKYVAALVMALALARCGIAGEQREEANEGSDAVEVGADMTGEAEAWADSVVGRMSREEMAGQLLMPAVYARYDEANVAHAARYIADDHIGGIILLKGTTDEARQLIDTLSHLARRPLFIAIDAEWGLGMRLEDAPVFPVNGRLGNLRDDRPLYDYGAEVARECREIGINMVLGPVLDVRPKEGSGFIGSRSFGSDSERVGDLGTAYARGLEDGGVISVAKHFPGHGSPQEDSHRAMPVINKSLHALDTLDLRPFRDYIASGLSGVMVGHLAVPAIDPELRPAAFSPVVMQDLLRDELGFRGLVLTDAINMRGAGRRTAADAVKAGADIVLAPTDTRADLSSLASLPDSILRDRTRRILLFKRLQSRK